MLTSPHSSSFPIPPKKKKNLNSLWNLNIRCDPLDKTLVKKKCTSRKGEGKQGDVGRSVGKEGNSRSSAPPNDQHTRAIYVYMCIRIYTYGLCLHCNFPPPSRPGAARHERERQKGWILRRSTSLLATPNPRWNNTRGVRTRRGSRGPVVHAPSPPPCYLYNCSIASITGLIQS